MRRFVTKLTLAAMKTLVCLAIVAGHGPAVAQNFEMTEAQLDQWLTNGAGPPLQLLESQLEAQLGRLEETCRLSRLQLEKLELAGRGDIARFEHDLAELSDRVLGKEYDQNEIGEVYETIQPYAARLRRGVLNEGSLFRKVFTTLLDDQQQTDYRRAEAERITFQYRAKVKLLVASLDQSAPMLDEQRRALLDLLLRTTRPPQRWSAEGQYDWYYILHQAAEAPRDEIASVLDGAQLRCFEAAVANAGGMKQMLVREGLVAMDEEAGNHPQVRRVAPQPAVDIPEVQIGNE